jgi:hypothetical protein
MMMMMRRRRRRRKGLGEGEEKDGDGRKGIQTVTDLGKKLTYRSSGASRILR